MEELTTEKVANVGRERKKKSDATFSLPRLYFSIN